MVAWFFIGVGAAIQPFKTTESVGDDVRSLLTQSEMDNNIKLASLLRETQRRQTLYDFPLRKTKDDIRDS